MFCIISAFFRELVFVKHISKFQISGANGFPVFLVLGIIFFLLVSPALPRAFAANTPPDSGAFPFVQLSTRDGNTAFVANGATLSAEGIAAPGTRMISGFIEDNTGIIIRGVCRQVDIDPETGSITGTLFIGTFRSAKCARLNLTVFDPTTKKTRTVLSNTLTVDNGAPEITILSPRPNARIQLSPFKIHGSATDAISGIDKVEISRNNGAVFHPAQLLNEGDWVATITPGGPSAIYTLIARAFDRAGHVTVSAPLTVHYQARKLPETSAARTYRPAPAAAEDLRPPPFSGNYQAENADKSPGKNGICTYRIISLSSNRFQPADLFTLDEEMAIIVRGFGGKEVTLAITDPDSGKTMFTLTDVIPPDMHKMWKWKLSKTGVFKAELIVDGRPRDDVFFKIVE